MVDPMRRLYCMVVNERKVMMNRGEAVRAYDSGFARVSFGDIVFEPDGSTRPFSEADRQEIVAATYELDK